MEPVHNPVANAGLCLPKTQAQFESNINSMLRLLANARDGSIMSLSVPKLVETDFSARSLTLSYALDPWMRNFSGVLHGGSLAALLDSTFGILTRCVSGRAGVVTSNLNINYLHSVKMDLPLLLTARVEHLGKSTVCLYGTGHQSDNAAEPSVSATGTFFLLS